MEISSLIKAALEEDIGAGDITTLATIPADRLASARFLAKQNLVLAGLDVAHTVFMTIDGSIEWSASKNDGELISKGMEFATVSGNARALVMGERTALNFLQRLSGIATLTRKYCDEIEGTGAALLDTRKTIPGFRELEKYAVRMGGGKNHRMGLHDRYLIKDNHISVAGSISKAVSLAMAAREAGQLVEVEARTFIEVREAIDSGADIILLDNMNPTEIADAVKFVAGRAKLEASGNITLENIRSYAETGVDFISTGAITHSATASDISMKIKIG